MLEPGTYTGSIEGATEDGVFTILLVGDGPRHEVIRYTLANVPGVVVKQISAEDCDLGHINGHDAQLCIVDEVSTMLRSFDSYRPREPRRGKGERKRNKAERWR
jgi:hypothetical protein